MLGDAFPLEEDLLLHTKPQLPSLSSAQTRFRHTLLTLALGGQRQKDLKFRVILQIHSEFERHSPAERQETASKGKKFL